MLMRDKGQIPLRYHGRRQLRSCAADRFEAGRRPAASWNLAYRLARQQRANMSYQVCDKSSTILGPVCDQDSVMEFGLDLVCDQVRAGSSYLDKFQLAAGLRPASDLPATRIAEWNLALSS